MTHFSYVQEILLGLVALIVAFAGFARRFSVSYPIVLVLAGLLCSLLPRVPRVPLPPDLVFLVFLPPLLFAAAWQTSWRDFRRNLPSISLLAIGLVFFTALGVALLAHLFLPNFDWRLGFLLGAIVSPTDAVAATSIARNVGMPKRIVDLLEGESLVNDATGLLALQFGLQMITEGTTPRFFHSLGEFLWLLLGGIGVGVLVGAVVAWADKWVDDGPVEIVLSFLVAYISYLAGEAVHASGVMATVCCGLTMSRKSSVFFSPAVRLQAEGVWDATEFLLNGLVFILIGFQLPYVLSAIQGYSHVQLALYGLAFAAALIALRLVWVFPGSVVGARWRAAIQHEPYERPSAKAVFVVGWTGMRGVLSLAAASSLPYTLRDGQPFPQRNIILFFTFTVILVTLVGQGLSLPPLLRSLHLKEGSDEGCEERGARRKLLEAALRYLNDRRSEAGEGNAAALDALVQQYEGRLHDLNESDSEDGTATPALSRREVLLATVRHERNELLRLYGKGEVGDATLRMLERELDLSESRYSR